MEINYCSFLLLHNNESKAAQYCCVAKERNNVVLVHFYVAGHRRHDVTETITCNSIHTHTHTYTIITTVVRGPDCRHVVSLE
jgi:hypothetical protein